MSTTSNKKKKGSSNTDSNVKDKVIKIKNKSNNNSSFVAGAILVLIAGFVLYVFFMTISKKSLAIYEVNKKSISDNDVVRGLVLRDETVVKSSSSGYINYFVGEGQKVGINGRIYSLDETGDVFKEITNELNVDTTDNMAIDEIRSSIKDFRNDYTPSNYESIQSFQYNINNTIEQISIEESRTKINKMLRNNRNTTGFTVYKSEKSGIVSYITDNKEDLKLRDITYKHFEDTSDSKNVIKQNSFVKTGDNVYKLINSNRWSIVVPVSESKYKNIKKQGTVSITLKKINVTTYPSTKTFKRDGKYYAVFTLSNYLEQYINSRYIDLQINLNGASGYQIPISSIVERKAFYIPKEFLTFNTDNNSCVFMDKADTEKKDSSVKNDYVLSEVSIYTTDEDGNYYISSNNLKEGVVIYSSTGKDYQLKAPKLMEGVYNCNYGYCKFNYIEVLYENSEFAIVSSKTSYGLSLYDHIVLNADIIDENDLIY
ncbi:MAG: hypothetical protein K6D02_04735 [Lachnospiraceae bacterium]|nr:hypothetical protein [Lachnospiraceae bacterium]